MVRVVAVNLPAYFPGNAIVPTYHRLSGLYFIFLVYKFSGPMFEYESSDNAMSKDALFLERLDTFMDKCLTDIKAFAERELRPYQEVF